MNCSFSAEDSNFNGSAVKASHAKAEDFKVLNVKGYGFTLIELLIVVVIIGIRNGIRHAPIYSSSTGIHTVVVLINILRFKQ